MVFILASENDQTTNNVIEWLINIGKKYLRIGVEDKIHIHCAEFDTKVIDWSILFSLNSDTRIYNLKEFDSFWYRKGVLKIESHFHIHQRDTTPRSSFGEYMKAEILPLEELFISVLERKPHIGNYFKSTPNKLKVLEAASTIGLSIPQSIITCKRSDLLRFYNEMGDIICKPIQDILSVQHEDIMYFTRTDLVTSEIITELPEFFPPSLFQKKIEKKFEIRTFYLNGNFYSMAIFSQDNQKTKIDFRNYDWNNSNRNVPLNLPKLIEQKLRKVFKSCKLNTGSADLIYSVECDYIFLEINPVGQFGNVSYECNYRLENKIAHFL